MKYTLIATNKQGASVEFFGHTQKEALENFDSVYERNGFIVTIYADGIEKQIKKTYR